MIQHSYVHIKAKEFGLFKDLDVKLDNGVYFVSGNNKFRSSADSNGSGKSMFLDCLHYGLTGKSYRGYLPDNIKSVSIDLGDLIIHRQPKQLQVIHQGKEVQLKNLDDKQKFIDSLLGDVSSNFSNWKFSGFTGKSDREKKEILEQFAFHDLPDFDNLQEKIRLKINELQKSLLDARANTIGKDQYIAQLQQQLEELKDVEYTQQLEDLYNQYVRRKQYQQEKMIEYSSQLQLLGRVVTCPKCGHNFNPSDNSSVENLDTLKKELEKEIVNAQRLFNEISVILKTFEDLKNKHAFKQKLETQLSQVLSSKRDDTKRIEEIENLISNYEVAKQVLAPTGIRSFIVSLFIHDFNKMLEYVSYKMTYGDLMVSLVDTTKLKSGEERSKVSVLVNGDPVERCSDGEQRMVNVIIQEVIRLLSPSFLQIHVLDETLSLLDESRFVSVVNYYRNSIQNGGILFVVSQDTDLSGYFDGVLTIVREKADYSTVSLQRSSMLGSY